MKSLRLFTALVAIALIAPSIARSESTCESNYLRYAGKLRHTTILRNGLVYFRLDEAIPQRVLDRCGEGAASRSLLAIRITSANEAAVKLMFSTALTAVATGADVVIRGRGRQGSALQIERIMMRRPER